MRRLTATIRTDCDKMQFSRSISLDYAKVNVLGFMP